LFGSEADASAAEATGLRPPGEDAKTAVAAGDDDFAPGVLCIWSRMLRPLPTPITTPTPPFPTLVGLPLPLPLSCSRLSGRRPGDAGMAFGFGRGAEPGPHCSVSVSVGCFWGLAIVM